MKRFLVDHQRIVSFVGVSIVLATFVLREVVRDYYKDLADSLDQAQSAYAIRAQLDVANERLRQTSHQVDFWGTMKYLRNNEKNGRAFENSVTLNEGFLEDDIPVIQDVESAQNNLNRLLRKLPSSDYPPELSKQASDLAQLKVERNQLDSAMDVCENAKKPDAKCSEDLVDSINRKIDNLDTKLLFMGIDLTKMSRPILEDAEEELARRERWYKWANIGSIVFFTAGWLLSLIGTMYDLPGLAPRET